MCLLFNVCLGRSLSISKQRDMDVSIVHTVVAQDSCVYTSSRPYKEEDILEGQKVCLGRE